MVGQMPTREFSKPTFRENRRPDDTGTLVLAAPAAAGSGTVTVSSGGSLVVSSGGSASGTRVSGGTEIVSSGGTETRAFLVSGGSQEVLGVTISTVLDGNDVQTVS